MIYTTDIYHTLGVCQADYATKAWMPGPSPGMTWKGWRDPAGKPYPSRASITAFNEILVQAAVRSRNAT